MREMSVTEQRYQAVQGVLADGRTVSEVASQWSVSRRTMHRWLARYEGDGLEGLDDGSHRPVHCPHQMPAAIEVMVLEMRRAHGYWGARRIAFELARKSVQPAPSESAVYRCLVRAGVIDPTTRRRRRETWKRWERGAAMELWQFDVVHGFLLADGTAAKGLDRHRRPLEVLRLGQAHGPGADAGGLRWIQFSAEGLRRPATGPDRQRQSLHGPLCPATGGGAIRPDLPGERHRPHPHAAP